MPRERSLRSISVPITLGTLTVVLAAALLTGWSILLAQQIAIAEDIGRPVWLLVLGAISFIVIMTVLVVFSVYWARDMLEVRRQTSFIDSVTHELKSPLASLKLCLETLGRSGVETAQREQLRRMMLDDVDRLSSFIDDVLQASRLTHQGLTMEAADVDLAQVARSCVSSVAARYRVPADAIEVDVPADLVLSTDRAAMELVLKNLIDNAVKYSDGRVQVQVVASLDKKGRVVVEVRDEGVGIPEKQLRRVFNRFYRVEDEAIPRRRGTGLGLFVVASVVRNHGGRVRALSEGPGHGTTMQVTLPASVRRRIIGAEKPLEGTA